MTNKEEREHKELMNLIKDPRYSRKFWQSVGNAIAARPAVKMPTLVDKEGNETLNSMIDNYSYKALKQDLTKLCRDDGQPTELEMIMQAQMIRARYDTGAAMFIRDTLGAKPVDESKADVSVSNPYENLSDEELEMLKKHRDELANKQELEQEQRLLEEQRRIAAEGRKASTATNTCVDADGDYHNGHRHD